VLKEYAKAPQVTRERLYIDTMQQVFQNTSKVYVDARGSGNLLYLPLDKLIQQNTAAGGLGTPPSTAGSASAGATPAPAAESEPRPRTDPRDSLRGRERP
jgi:membrane protease subunit HflK